MTEITLKNVDRSLIGNRTGFLNTFETTSLADKIVLDKQPQIIPIMTSEVGYTITFKRSSRLFQISYHKGDVDKPIVHGEFMDTVLEDIISFYNEFTAVEESVSVYDSDFQLVFHQMRLSSGQVETGFGKLYSPRNVDYYYLREFLFDFKTANKTHNGFKRDYALIFKDNVVSKFALPYFNLAYLLGMVIIDDLLNRPLYKFLKIDEKTKPTDFFLKFLFYKAIDEVIPHDLVAYVLQDINADVLDVIIKAISTTSLRYVDTEVVDSLTIENMEELVEHVFPETSGFANKQTEETKSSSAIFIDVNGIFLKDLIEHSSVFFSRVLSAAGKHLHGTNDFLLVNKAGVDFMNLSDEEFKAIGLMGINKDTFKILINKDLPMDKHYAIVQVFNNLLKDKGYTIQSKAV